MRSSRPLLLTTALTAALALSACGSNSLSTPSTSGAAPAGSASATSTGIAKNDALAAKVPAKAKSAGKLIVGVDATYAPNEYLADDGKTVVGMDVEILDAVAAKLGLKTEWQPSTFDTILLGVGSGKFDVAMSSFTINDDRKKSVNMVSYFNAGTQWAVAKGNPKKIDPKNLCGVKVGVQKGTVQNDEMTAATKKCTDGGKPAIDLTIDDQQSKITAALQSGKVDAMAADSPITFYAIKQTGDAMEKLGETYDSAPYGIVVPKDQTDFAKAVADALTELKASGDYEKILKKWGNESGGISSFAVNP